MAALKATLGPNTATRKVLDGSGDDITGTSTYAATSSDPTAVSIGTPSTSTPNVIPFTSLKEGGSSTLTITATNTAGNVVNTDTLSIVITAPSSITVTYATTVP